MRSLLFALLIAVPFATAPAADTPLTWDECRRLALDHNPDIIAARDALAARKEAVHKSVNGVLPSLSLSASYRDVQGGAGDGRWGASARADLSIFDLSRYAAISSARANARSADGSLRLASADVRLSLQQAFADVLLSQEQRLVTQRILELRQTNTALVRLRYNSGRESKGNAMRADAELLQAKASVTAAERDRVSAAQELNRQLGRDQWDVLTATFTWPTLAAPGLPEIDSAVLNHPSVRIAQANVDSAKADVRSAQSDVFPTLSADYTRGATGPSFFPDQETWSAGASLSYPIFAGGPTAAFNAINESKFNRSRADEQLRSTENSVRSTLYSTWASLADAVDNVSVQNAFVEAARQRNGEADARYTNGLMTYEDWELIVTDRVNFEQSVVRAQRDLFVSQAQWNHAQGRGLEDE
jgi:outer membrane protein